MKTQEVIELPEQIEQKIYVKPTKEYRHFMKNGYLVLDDGTELVGDNSLTKILYARQLCGMYHQEKMDAFRDLLESTEDRVIVFYNFNEELTRLRKICEALDREVSFVNGSGRSMYAYECVENSVTFIQYQPVQWVEIFRKQIRSFTHPATWQGSCDLWEQSKKRIHRIGQDKSCFYYYLLVKGSFEEKNFGSIEKGEGTDR